MLQRMILHRLLKSGSKLRSDPYVILGLDRNADDRKIKAAYYREVAWLSMMSDVLGQCCCSLLFLLTSCRHAAGIRTSSRTRKGWRTAQHSFSRPGCSRLSRCLS